MKYDLHSLPNRCLAVRGRSRAGVRAFVRGASSTVVLLPSQSMRNGNIAT